MPDITATRPAAGAPIESAWGGGVHDAVEGIQAGKATVTFASSTASGAVVVTFPRPYATPPNVVASIGALGNYWGLVGGITATQCQVQARSPVSIASGSVDVHWVAVGTPA